MSQGISGLSQCLKHREQVFQLQAAGTDVSKMPKGDTETQPRHSARTQRTAQEPHANQLQVPITMRTCKISSTSRLDGPRGMEIH